MDENQEYMAELSPTKQLRYSGEDSAAAEFRNFQSIIWNVDNLLKAGYNVYASVRSMDGGKHAAVFGVKLEIFPTVDMSTRLDLIGRVEALEHIQTHNGNHIVHYASVRMTRSQFQRRLDEKTERGE
ncbi:hypothetical protein K435DRAFT_805559 [Dendrothele bispora CBS 962.96]|uniref:Uncharacterized protein n=1 Tax=Dendrothele bispora (strain CBS 962.96) TaxID=1314807 RepID=A0A4S8LB46_DENBC|nr:hypothetical protein K435DRAFT_805559 [Dendrothele bispora CBS 962.96]